MSLKKQIDDKLNQALKAKDKTKIIHLYYFLFANKRFFSNTYFRVRASSVARFNN